MDGRAELRALVEDAVHMSLTLGGTILRPEMPLAELVEGFLIPDGTRPVLPPVLQRVAQLSHLQALYLELERGPEGGAALAGVALAYRDPLGELCKDLDALTDIEPLKDWLPVLHDLLTEQLVTDRWPANAPLGEYLGFAAGDDPPECFPENIQLRHALSMHQWLLTNGDA